MAMVAFCDLYSCSGLVCTVIIDLAWSWGSNLGGGNNVGLLESARWGGVIAWEVRNFWAASLVFSDS